MVDDDVAARAMPRVVQPLRLVGFVVACVIALVAAFALGFITRDPTKEALSASAQKIQVTAAVVERPFGDNSLGTGSVAAGQTVEVAAPQASGVRQVVTAAGPSVGSSATAPAFLGAVNGQPTFAVHTSIPLYRDLGRGDTGPDVAALQAAFGVPVTSRVTSSLQSAVSALFKAAGFQLSSGAPIPAAELVAVPAATFTVTKSVTLGQLLNSDTKLASLQVSPNVVVVRVPINRIDAIKVGAAVTVLVGAASLPGKVASIGTFKDVDPNKPGSIAGHDVTVTLDDSSKAETLDPGLSATVETTDAAPKRLVVPAQALRTAADGGTYLLVKDKTVSHRANVEVGGEVDGYVSVSGKITPGDRVVIN